MIRLSLSGRFFNFVVFLFLFEEQHRLQFKRFRQFAALLLKVFINFVLLIKQLYTQVIALAKLFYRHLYLLLHLAKHNHPRSLTRTLTIHCQPLYRPQLLPKHLQLLLRSQLTMLIAKLSNQSVKPPLFLQLSPVLTV